MRRSRFHLHVPDLSGKSAQGSLAKQQIDLLQAQLLCLLESEPNGRTSDQYIETNEDKVESVGNFAEAL